MKVRELIRLVVVFTVSNVFIVLVLVEDPCFALASTIIFGLVTARHDMGMA
jgi:hypothetical protein